MKRLNWVIKHRGEYYRKWIKLNHTNYYIDRNRMLLRAFWSRIHTAPACGIRNWAKPSLYSS
jgi:hypothetical protein